MSKRGWGVRPTGLMLRVRRVNIRLLLAGLLGLGWAGACSDDPSGPAVLSPPTLTVGLVVSDPSVALTSSVRASPAAPVAVENEDVAYASLMPNTAPQGSIASVRGVASGSLIWTTVIDGGFDPVAVMAGSGDTIEVVVRDVLGAEVYTARMAVAAFRRPVIVRTEPPPKKRDVPLNSSLVIVFSEPVAEATLSRSSVRLFRSSFAIPLAGTVRLLPGSGAAVVFRPSSRLTPNTDYRLEVTQAIRDLQGDALAVGATVAFTTGQSVVGPPATIDLSPDTVEMTGATYQMTPTVRDAAGNQLVDQPITWSTSDPSGLTVSPTGLLTGLAGGGYYVTARVDSLAAYAAVWVGGPPASVSVAPTPTTVAEGDTVMLVATVRDALDRSLPYPAVTWSSTDMAVATVTPAGSDDLGRALATVLGVAIGNVAITAASGSASGTTSLTVSPPQPVGSVTVAPKSTTILVQQRSQLSVTVRDINGRVVFGRPVTWSTGDSAVAKVDANGLVTAVGSGSTAVTATSEAVSDAAVITVPVPVPPADIAGEWWFTYDVIEPFSLEQLCTTSGTIAFSQTGHLVTASSALGCEVRLGEGYIAGNELRFTDGCDYWFQAYTSDAIAATAPDRMYGSASCSGDWYQRSFNGARIGRTARISGLPASREVPLGTTAQLVATAVDAAGNPLPFAVTWSSDNSAVATVSPSGLVTGVAGGTATITAAADGQSATVSITVTELGFRSVSTAFLHTCGTTAGSTYCWGQIIRDAGGVPVGDNSPLPIAVSGGIGFDSVSTGYDHECGLTPAGAAYCWGTAGQLGNGASTPSGTPVPVSGGLIFASVSAGAYHTCGVTTTGAAYCWGSNLFGQLGIGDTAVKHYLVPVEVTGGLTFSSVSAGVYHTCGVTTTGAVYCWGKNDFGQLGIGSTDDQVHPMPLPVGGGWTFGSVSAGGDYYTCAVTTAGLAYCWGYNSYGQLGIGSADGQAHPTPVPVAGGHEFGSVSTDRSYSNLGRTCAVTTGGAAYCWGAKYIGQSAFVPDPTPALVPGGLLFASVSVGLDHACGRTTSGIAYCWGGNTKGQLGDGSLTDSSVPVKVAGQP